MADISLPDDVFENMRHAQEAAAEMEASVEKFNDNVDKKFKEKDANEKNKTGDGVNSILTTKEKTRYKNIGIAFFSGAKDSIVAIFKQIDKDRSKSLLKKATGAVSNAVASIKEQAEEHKTTSKIFAAVALVAGIYFLFKKWFDEKIPPIWEKIKEASENIPTVISALGDTIGKIFDGSGIAENISTFFKDSLTEIKGFLQRMLDFFKDVFKNTNSDEQTVENITTPRENSQQIELYTRSTTTLNGDYESKKFEVPIAEINNAKEKLDKILKNATPKQIEIFKKYLNGDSLKSIVNTEEEKKFLNEISTLYINTQGDFHNSLVHALAETKGFFENQKTVIMEGEYGELGNENAQRIKNVVNSAFTEKLNQIEAISKEKQSKEQSAKEERIAQNHELLENANADKIVDVAVVTNLNQFIKDFFTGDKEGTFKHFSSTAIATIGAELSNINSTVKTELTNISNLVKEKLTSLIDYEKLDKLVEKLLKTQNLIIDLRSNIVYEFDTLYEDLTKHSEEKVKNDLKNFITEKFNNTFNGNNTQIFADIIKEEQAQTASLKEQSRILEDTKKLLNQLLYLSGGNTNQVVPVPVQQNNNDIPTSAVPLGSTAADISTAVYFSSGMSPYSMA